jgi:hypothetical protein
VKLQLEFSSADEVVDLLEKLKNFFLNQDVGALTQRLKTHTDALQVALETKAET